MPMSDGFTFAVPVLIASLIVVIVYRRDLILIAVTAGALHAGDAVVHDIDT